MADVELKIIKPDKSLEIDYRAAITEFRELGENNIESLFSRCADNFDAYLKATLQAEGGYGLPEGYVPFTTFWTVMNNEKIVGFCNFRHYLTPSLKIEGGHIGYSIRPSERKKGYGTRQLALILEECRWMAYTRVMVTCDFDNIGSYKIIEANGGKLTGVAISPRSNKKVNQYWIDL
ncbi:MAG: GNAT family N-acetyltransferase [Chloroflexi bacterium HGW-Chloroflexi-8]|nr:MAG: GNAT family N-acetyltransferase [Chloroflexi bacterium HGW-Chloroflexi-8]